MVRCIVVTKHPISPTGDRFGLLASGKRPPPAHEVDVFRTSNWQCPETVRKSSTGRTTSGRQADGFRTLLQTGADSLFIFATAYARLHVFH